MQATEEGGAQCDVPAGCDTAAGGAAACGRRDAGRRRLLVGGAARAQAQAKVASMNLREKAVPGGRAPPRSDAISQPLFISATKSIYRIVWPVLQGRGMPREGGAKPVG